MYNVILVKRGKSDFMLKLLKLLFFVFFLCGCSGGMGKFEGSVKASFLEPTKTATVLVIYCKSLIEKEYLILDELFLEGNPHELDNVNVSNIQIHDVQAKYYYDGEVDKDAGTASGKITITDNNNEFDTFDINYIFNELLKDDEKSLNVTLTINFSLFLKNEEMGIEQKEKYRNYEIKMKKVKDEWKFINGFPIALSKK